MYSTYYNPELFPLIRENSVPDNICDDIVGYTEANLRLFKISSGNTIDYWKNRTIDYKLILDEDIKKHIRQIARVMFMGVNSLSLVPDTLVPDTMDVVRWSKGDKLDPPHYDNINPDGTPNYTPWRHMTAMVYLNDNFENGEIFWPEFGIEYKPKKGAIAVFPSDINFLHGVREITEGVRYTLSSFYTYDFSKAYNWNSDIRSGK